MYWLQYTVLSDDTVKLDHLNSEWHEYIKEEIIDQQDRQEKYKIHTLNAVILK